MRKFKIKMKKLCGVFLISSLLVNYFSPILNVFAAESTTSGVYVQVIGSDFEYDIDAGDNNKDASNIRFSINGGETFNLDSTQVDYHYTNEKITSYTSKNDYDYSYIKNGETVTFNFVTQWDDLITSLKINGTQYISQVPTTKEQLINAFDKDIRTVKFNITDVPYASNYTITVVGGKQTDKIMGNFGWSYNVNDDVQDDEKIPHGKLEFVKAVYNGHTYDTIESINAAGNIYQWIDGIKKVSYGDGDRSGHGEAMFPTGTELTLKLIPDTGYQLTSLDLNGQSFAAGDEVGTYTFTITDGNFHLGASFTEGENVVKSDSESIESGSIDIDLEEEDSFENGTAKLKVSDVNPSTKDDFEDELPEGYEVDNYLDISLYNSIYKGTDNSDSSWDSKVDELENEATINLTLTDDMSGKDIKVIHELHEGDTITGYEVIDATYDEETNTISFETDGFSNYALISKDSETEDYSVSDRRGNKIEFDGQVGHTYNFDMISYTEITDEELEALGMTREVYNTLLSGIQNATKKYGNVLAVYEMILVDENDDELHDGPFKIKIKMTDDMKKYNTFNVVYTDVDNDFATEEPIKLTVEGDYLVGTLEHLSVYTLVGYNTVNENPKTSDSISKSVILGSISLISLISCGLYIKKRNN